MISTPLPAPLLSSRDFFCASYMNRKLLMIWKSHLYLLVKLSPGWTWRQLIIITAIMYSWAIRYSSTVRGSGIRYSLINILSWKNLVSYHPYILAKHISPSRILNTIVLNIIVTTREILLNKNHDWHLHPLASSNVIFCNGKRRIFFYQFFIHQLEFKLKHLNSE